MVTSTEKKGKTDGKRGGIDERVLWLLALQKPTPMGDPRLIREKNRGKKKERTKGAHSFIFGAPFPPLPTDAARREKTSHRKEGRGDGEGVK